MILKPGVLLTLKQDQGPWFAESIDRRNIPLCVVIKAGTRFVHVGNSRLRFTNQDGVCAYDWNAFYGWHIKRAPAPYMYTEMNIAEYSLDHDQVMTDVKDYIISFAGAGDQIDKFFDLFDPNSALQGNKSP